VDEAAETVGGEAVGSVVAAAVPWARQGGSCHCLRGVRHGPNAIGPWFGLGGSRVGRAVLIYFSNYPNRLKHGN
jgi:hypothetical protein